MSRLLGESLPAPPEPSRWSGRRSAIAVVLGFVNALYWPTMLQKVMNDSGRYGNQLAALLFIAIPLMLILSIVGTALSIAVLRKQHDRRAVFGVITNGIIPLVALSVLIYWLNWTT